MGGALSENSRASGPIPGQTDLREAIVQRGDVPEIKVAIRPHDGESAALAVESHVDQSSRQFREVEQWFERQGVTQHHTVVDTASGQEVAIGAQGQALNRAVVGFLESMNRDQFGEREAADGSAFEGHNQAAALRIEHEPADPSRQRDPSFHETALEVKPEHRVTAVGYQAAITIEEADRPDFIICHESPKRAAAIEFPDDDVSRLVTPGKSLPRAVEGEAACTIPGGEIWQRILPVSASRTRILWL